MEAVARNIYQFFHVILVKAHDEPLWTRNSLERSIQWAKYCEKVHHEAISKGYASYVEMLLKDMSRLTPDRRVVSFDDLKLSSQLLVAELLQCPLLRKATVQTILESELAQEPWLEVMCEIFVINSILKDLVEEKEDNQPKCGGEIEMLTEKLFGLSGNALDMHLDLLARKSPRLQEHAETMEPCFTAGADEWVLTRNSPAIAWDWKRVAEVWTALKEMADGASSSSSVVTAFLKQAQRGSRGDFWDDLLFHCEPYRNRCHNTRKPVVFTPSVKSGS
ncbi:uncharacterized protein LOC142578915 isoform X3 [Dermacentor variabilis]|uniref:uncharacterized protein LOC142578915 isoform X3 n=1 Tax=Dermacentor variabilis TaxID=34621 RepID=UPI003F5B9CA5